MSSRRVCGQRCAKIMALYVLVDGIYPLWSIFVGPNIAALDRKEAYFKKRQEVEGRKLNGFSVFARKISYSTTGKARMERRNYHFDF